MSDAICTVVCGKYLPLHKGHEYLIVEAAKHCELKGHSLRVMVIANKHDTLDPLLRKSWIDALLDDTFQNLDSVVDVIDDIYNDDDSSAWATYAQQCYPNTIIESIFSSEPYGNTWAEEISKLQESPCESFLIDVPRTTHNVSGTLVRSDLLENFKSVSEHAKADLCTRIVVLGAESTGTSTLALRLAKHYKTPIPFEYGRWYTESLLPQAGGCSEGIEWEPQDFLNIAQVQDLYEDQMAGKADKGFIICDTDAFVTRIFERVFLDGRSHLLDHVTGRGDLYIVTDYRNVTYELDGTRIESNGSDARREKFQDTIVQLLEDAGKNFIMVSGSNQSRLVAATASIDELLSQKQYGLIRAID